MNSAGVNSAAATRRPAAGRVGAELAAARVAGSHTTPPPFPVEGGREVAASGAADEVQPMPP